MSNPLFDPIDLDLGNVVFILWLTLTLVGGTVFSLWNRRLLASEEIPLSRPDIVRVAVRGRNGDRPDLAGLLELFEVAGVDVDAEELVVDPEEDEDEDEAALEPVLVGEDEAREVEDGEDGEDEVAPGPVAVAEGHVALRDPLVLVEVLAGAVAEEAPEQAHEEHHEGRDHAEVGQGLHHEVGISSKFQNYEISRLQSSKFLPYSVSHFRNTKSQYCMQKNYLTKITKKCILQEEKLKAHLT